MSVWLPLNDFNHLSWEGRAVCASCGSAKRKTEQYVYRPLNVLDEVNGHPDLCEGCVREVASTLGIAETEPLILEVAALTSDVVHLRDQLTATREALATVTRENVRLQDVLDALYEPAEESLDDYLAAEDADS